ncbi:vegetative incompatibility WD repeat [Brachionus plicatilis]|uniref:Vegetative incompatibility WD repeat n=1 Tax=Brachionus plicatilis TaxID=10195 RepID=A0A3M7SUI0_BRAPC|nr:vegetative incompatibility WD repeat [Brachionus plicatilis]
MTLENISDSVFHLAVLKNGDLASSYVGATIKIWNPNDGSVKFTLNEVNHWVLYLAVLKNGDLVSGSNDGKIKIWNTINGQLKNTFIPNSLGIMSLAILQNGDLASGSRDGTIKILNANDGKMAQFLIVLKNGDLAIWCIDGTIKIWDTTDGILKMNINATSECAKWLCQCLRAFKTLKNGDFVSANYNTIKIWNTNDGSLKKTITDPVKTRKIKRLAVLYNGDLAVGYDDGTENKVKTKSDTQDNEEKSNSSYSKESESIIEGDKGYDCKVVQKGYFNCNDNKCPDKKLFDEKSKTCKEFKDVICGNRSLSNEEKDEKDLCSSRLNGSYPNIENSCAEFFMCENSKTVKKSNCPNGLKFNVISIKCDYEKNIPPPCGTKIVSKHAHITEFNFAILFSLLTQNKNKKLFGKDLDLEKTDFLRRILTSIEFFYPGKRKTICLNYFFNNYKKRNLFTKIKKFHPKELLCYLAMA